MENGPWENQDTGLGGRGQLQPLRRPVDAVILLSPYLQLVHSGHLWRGLKGPGRDMGV